MCVVEKNTKKNQNVGFEGFLTPCGWLKSHRVVDMHWPPWVNGHIRPRVVKVPIKDSHFWTCWISTQVYPNKKDRLFGTSQVAVEM